MTRALKPPLRFPAAFARTPLWRAVSACVVLLCAVLACGAPARAGGGAVEGLPDNPEDGPPFFGEAIDVKGHARISGVQVRADFGKSQYLLSSTDPEGDFHFSGFGKDVDPESVRISCAMKGYRLIDATRQRSSGAADAPVHIECLMEKE